MGISFTQNTQENRKSYKNAIVSYLGEHQKNLVDSGHHGYNRHTERPLIEKNVSDLF